MKSAEERWGHTEAYKESVKRTQTYSSSTWEVIKKESEEIEERFVTAMIDGMSPLDKPVLDIAEEARLHISKWFYPCSREMHCKLGEMYMSDSMFRAHYDNRLDGLAEFVSTAISTNYLLNT